MSLWKRTSEVRDKVEGWGLDFCLKAMLAFRTTAIRVFGLPPKSSTYLYISARIAYAINPDMTEDEVPTPIAGVLADTRDGVDLGGAHEQGQELRQNVGEFIHQLVDWALKALAVGGAAFLVLYSSSFSAISRDQALWLFGALLQALATFCALGMAVLVFTVQSHVTRSTAAYQEFRRELSEMITLASNLSAQAREHVEPELGSYLEHLEAYAFENIPPSGEGYDELAESFINKLAQMGLRKNLRFCSKEGEGRLAHMDESHFVRLLNCAARMEKAVSICSIGLIRTIAFRYIWARTLMPVAAWALVCALVLVLGGGNAGSPSDTFPTWVCVVVIYGGVASTGDLIVMAIRLMQETLEEVSAFHLEHEE